MRILRQSGFLTGLTIACSLMGASGLHAQAKHDVEVAISAVNDSVKVGEPINVHVVLSNHSSQDVELATPPTSDAADQHYSIHVVRKNGEVVPSSKNGQGKDKKEMAVGSVILRTIPPGYTLEENALLTNLFSMSSPGIYRIWFEIFLNGKNIKSNEITIQVTPER